MYAGVSSDMDKENLAFPHHFPYDFASPYSTESESDDEDVYALTRRFSRSASLKEPLYNLKEKRVFSGSPESTLAWLGSIPSQAPSPPPFVRNDEDAWNMIYAAAGQVARMKMRMSLSNGGAGVVANKNNSGLPEAPRGFAHLYCSPRACSPANLPARTIPYSNNTHVSITGQPQTQARINVGLVPHYEMLMGRRNAMIQAAQQLRSSLHGSVMESPVSNPEVLLPREWTY
ncbi:hypothetical protein L1887_16608 [Cichorium endivia]|nr:hypothetical protein L1887_16608 [Cichorium endivia]